MAIYVYNEINYGEFLFDLQTKSDATVILATIPESQWPPTSENKSIYKICLGSDNNTKTYISIGESTYLAVKSENILSELKPQRFWIKWGGGFLSVGLDSYDEPFIKCPFKNIKHVHHIRFQSIHDATWKMYKPPDYKTIIESIKTGPCINNAITTLEMNFGMIYLSVFGTNCSIRFSSGPDISIPVYEFDVTLPEKCSLNTHGCKKIQKIFSDDVKQKIKETLKSNQLIGFWICWFNEQISLGLKDNYNTPIIISEKLDTNVHLSSVGWSTLTNSECPFTNVFCSKWHGIKFSSDGLIDPDFKMNRRTEAEIEQFRFNCERPTWIVIDKLNLKLYICAAVFGIPIDHFNSSIAIEKLNTREDNHCDAVLATIKKYYDRPTYTLGLTLIHYYVKSVKLLNVLLRIYREDGLVSFLDLSSITFYEQFHVCIGHIMKLRAENPEQINETDSIHYPPCGIYSEKESLVHHDSWVKNSFNKVTTPILNHPPSRNNAYFSIQKYVVNPEHFRTWLPGILTNKNYSTHKTGLVTNFLLQGGYYNDLTKLWKLLNSYILPYDQDFNVVYEALKNSVILRHSHASYLSCLKYKIPLLNNLSNPYKNTHLILIHLSYVKLYKSFSQFFQTNSARLVVIASDIMSYLISEIKYHSTSLYFEFLRSKGLKFLEVKLCCSVKKNIFYSVILNFIMKLSGIVGAPLLSNWHIIFKTLIVKFGLVVIEASKVLHANVTLKLIEFCANWLVDKINKLKNDYEESKIMAKTKCADFNETEFDKMFCLMYNLNIYTPETIVEHIMATTMDDIKLLIEDYDKSFHPVNPTYRILQPIEPNMSTTFMYYVPVKSGPKLYREIASIKHPTCDFSKHTIFRRYEEEKCVYLESKDNQSEYPLVLFKWEKSSVFECGIVIFLKKN